MADKPVRILGHQRQREITVCAQPIDEVLLVAVAKWHIGKRGFGEREDRGFVACVFGADSNGDCRAHPSKCP